MKFLIDQQLPRALAALLNLAGHEALHVRDLELEFAADRDIWNAAANLGATIISKERILAVRRGERPGPKSCGCASAIAPISDC